MEQTTTQIAVVKQDYPLTVFKKDELYVKASKDKQAEITNFLAKSLEGIEDWEKQVKAIEVKNIDDKISIELADTYRKNLKQTRVKYEKFFDEKREEVKRLKSEYDLQDKLLLKAKQVMVIKFKAVEEAAEWKANFVKRFKEEQKELRTQKRINEVSKYVNETLIDFEEMTDEDFTTFLEVLKEEKEKRILAEQKAEAERIAKEKADAEARELQRIENEKLKAQIEADRIVNEKRIAEEEKIRKAEKEANDKKQAELNAQLKAESEAKAKIEAELRAKEYAELKAKKEAQIKAELERKAAEQKAQEPVEKRLLNWIDSFELPALEVESEHKEVIISKFEYFKHWAKAQAKKDIDSLRESVLKDANHIVQKAIEKVESDNKTMEQSTTIETPQEIGKKYWFVSYDGAITEAEIISVDNKGVIVWKRRGITNFSNDTYKIIDEESSLTSTSKYTLEEFAKYYSKYSDDFDIAIQFSKELFEKVINPNGIYKVAQDFDNVFEKYVSEHLSKADARIRKTELEAKKRHLVSYRLVAVNELTK